MPDPTLDPFTPTLAEQRAEAEALFELTELVACRSLRPIARRQAALLASGQIRREGATFRLTRRRLAIRAPSKGGLFVVLRRGAETVRLPFA